MDQIVIVALVMLISIIILLNMGAPISVSIGLGSFLAMMFIFPFDNATQTASSKIFNGINSFSLLAIPFFILAGNIMNSGGIAARLVNSSRLISGRMPGALLQTNVVANTMFGALSGSGVAAAAAIGGTMGPLQQKEGYDKTLSTAVNIVSAPTGMLIPPSNTLIVYATVAGSVSVSALFIAGYIPGLLWSLSVMIIAGIIAKKKGYVTTDKYTFKEKMKITFDALPSLLLIVIVIGGILKGVFTATEASAIAVMYSLLLSFAYRSLTIKELPAIIIASTKMTAIVIFMIGMSTIMAFLLAYTHIPAFIASLLLGLTDSFFVILLIMNVILLIIGTFMDPTPAVLIFTPIFLPICLQFGMDPVQFGIMIVFNLSIGTITPPVGPILFTGCKVGNTKIEEVIKPMLPFYAAIFIVLLLVTYIPAISMWLPQLLGLVS
ncbi:TRAP transporter large permease [Mollicutes bacterium LVI A0039]|nr:TRAP transporter large permease [Mollicutes bacterium LVI A0039]